MRGVGRSAAESMAQTRRGALALVLLALATSGASPASASAHGPVAPIASSYLARVTAVPAGVEAKVVDGDQRLWMRVRRGEDVVVLDSRGAPYLRFSAAGVEVNQSSAMYYLNLSPPDTSPPALTRSTPPKWRSASDGDDYGWHDGRLHALAAVALSPGVAYVGRWSIPVLVDGRLSSISGALWHADNPSIVWFWPAVVVLLCTLAAARVARPELDAVVSRVLAAGSLIGVALAGAGVELHGQPFVSVFQLITLALVAGFVAWGSIRVVSARSGEFWKFVVSGAAAWAGLALLPTLLHGFVLMALPAFAARTATVLCLGCGVSLLVLWFRVVDFSDAAPLHAEGPCDGRGGPGETTSERRAEGA